jgi:hypothetical protein
VSAEEDHAMDEAARAISEHLYGTSGTVLPPSRQEILTAIEQMRAAG